MYHLSKRALFSGYNAWLPQQIFKDATGTCDWDSQALDCFAAAVLCQDFEGVEMDSPYKCVYAATDDEGTRCDDCLTYSDDNKWVLNKRLTRHSKRVTISSTSTIAFGNSTRNIRAIACSMSCKGRLGMHLFCLC